VLLVRIGEKFERWVKRNLPDPLSIALFLTVLISILALFLTDSTTPISLADAWMKGFWSLISFAMQVSLSIVLGCVFFSAPFVKKHIEKLCSIPKTSKQATIFLYFIVYVLTWFNWGIGFISAGFLTKAVANNFNKKKVPYHLPIIAAAAQTGTVSYASSWNSAVLIMIGQEGHFAQDALGIIPLAKSIFTPISLYILLGWIVLSVIIYYFMHPVDQSKFIMAKFDDETGDMKLSSEKQSIPPATTFAEKFDRIWFWSIGLVILWGIWIIKLMITVGPNAINLDVANITILVFGLLLWKYPLRFFQSFKENTPSAAGVMLQFHLYAGIMGIMRYTGLVDVISEAFASISTAETFPLMSYISSSVINMAIPSGGGQWVAQGPVLIGTAQRLGADLFQTTMAFSFSSSLMDLAIPFWVLPIAGILKIETRDIMGYTIAATILLTIYTCAILLLTGYGILPAW
jgi:short-chain fatty acids transporter